MTNFLEREGEVSYFFGNLLAGSLMEGLRSRDYAGGAIDYLEKDEIYLLGRNTFP